MKISKYICGIGLASILGLLALPLTAQEGLVKSVEKAVVGAMHQMPSGPNELLKSVFYATNPVGMDMGFSGTIFKTTYQGKEEIYGVIAAHTLTEKFAELKLGQGFTAKVLTDQGIVELPAKVVQHSSPAMLDLALVEFRPEDKKLLTPLTIRRETVQAHDFLQSGGFALGRSVFYSERRVLSSSPFVFRSPIGGMKENRTGLCGGFVTNQNQLVGIYTGSLSWEGELDMGYATHAKYLNNLVDAYHHNGEGTFPFVIDNDHILNLRVDEYISDIEIYDTFEEKQYHLRFKNRFSYNDVITLLNDYAPRYMDITVRRTTWGRSGRVPVLMQNSGAWLDRNCMTYRYDLKEKKIIWGANRATLSGRVFEFLGM